MHDKLDFLSFQHLAEKFTEIKEAAAFSEEQKEKIYKDKSRMQKTENLHPVILFWGRASPLPDHYFFFRRLLAFSVPLYSLRPNKRRLHLNAAASKINY